ncbi:hypothetical protein Hte_002933 [Hypoxylon texense]
MGPEAAWKPLGSLTIESIEQLSKAKLVLGRKPLRGTTPISTSDSAPQPPETSTPAATTPSPTTSEQAPSYQTATSRGAVCTLCEGSDDPSYTFTNGGDAIDELLPADDGCTAMFKCDDDEAYAKGMAGCAIIAAFDYMYAND